ncbi:MAG: hypothetical protein BWX56_01516 [Euryarchaeota archaeon ADurb.Bin023]|jgi:hypothetical protein|nr:MAG: hypothetical protein BWX56_01516 [Euryarchaeota archaeon ADurb.Bin023]
MKFWISLFHLLCLQSKFLFFENTTNAEANVVVAVGCTVVVTIGNSAIAGIVVPATATFNTIGSALLNFTPN